MKNVDIEIYINQFITFFNKNPNDLIDLIGDLLKDDFYEKVKEQCYKNLENNQPVELTKNQLISVVVELKNIQYDEIESKNIESIIQRTQFASFSLN
jgi:hypothetical protein